MGHYLLRASYTQQGIQGVLKEGGTARARAVEAVVASAGGSASMMLPMRPAALVPSKARFPVTIS